MQCLGLAVVQSADARRHCQPKYIVCRLKDRRVRTEIVRKQDTARLTVRGLRIVRKAAVLFQKNAGVSQPEAVDGLLDVADKEEILPLSRDRREDRILHAVGVLIFVDHDLCIAL